MYSDTRVRASITAGEEPAESSLAEREKERESVASVSRDGGWKRAKTRALCSHSLLGWCAPFSLAAVTFVLQLLNKKRQPPAELELASAGKLMSPWLLIIYLEKF